MSKPGWQTSEFWLSLLALLSSVLPQFAAVVIPGGGNAPAVVASTAALAAVYTGARSYVKAKEAAAAAAAASVELAPFGAMTAAEKAASK